MARVNINILGVSELKWTGMGKFNSDDHYIDYCGQESLRRNGLTLTVNKRVWNAVLGCHFKNNRMISVRFQGKPFSITVIQVYAPTTNAKEAEFQQFNEDIQDLLELIPKKRYSFHHRRPECKSRSQEIPGVTGKFGPEIQNKAGQRLTVLPRKRTGHSKNPVPTTREKSLHMDITMWPDGQYWDQIDYILFSWGWRSSTPQKQDQELTVAQIMNSLLPNSDLNWRK